MLSGISMDIMVSVIIINYNTFNLTCKCIDSIIAHTKDISYEIILVDNASTKCDAEEFKKKYPGIKLIQSPVNLGFSKGNNLGIKESKGNYILLLNSDTELTGNSIKISYDNYKSLHKPGFMGIKTLNPDGSIQPTCSKLPSVKTALSSLFSFRKTSGSDRDYHAYDRLFSPGALYGSYLFFDRKLLKSFKDEKLNETFFMYNEDILWCWEAKKSGHINYFLPDATIIHYGNASHVNDLVKKNMSKEYRENGVTLKKIINGRIGYPLFILLEKLIDLKVKTVMWWRSKKPAH